MPRRTRGRDAGRARAARPTPRRPGCEDGGDVPHPRPPPAGVLPAHPARGAPRPGWRCWSPAARRRRPTPRETVTSEQADELAAQVGGAGGAGGRVRRGRVPPTRRWPRRWPSWPAQAGEQLDRLQAAAPGADSVGVAVGAAAPAGPDARAGCAARWPRPPPRTPRPAWTSRAPGRRCWDRSPRVCAARTEDWRDRRWLTTRRPGALDERTENAALRRGPGRRARRGLGLRRRRAPRSAPTRGSRPRTPRRPTATSATRSAPCSADRKADVGRRRGRLRAAVPGAVRGRRRRARPSSWRTASPRRGCGCWTRRPSGRPASWPSAC